jgi:hypothetical protein
MSVDRGESEFDLQLHPFTFVALLGHPKRQAESVHNYNIIPYFFYIRREYTQSVTVTITFHHVVHKRGRFRERGPGSSRFSEFLPVDCWGTVIPLPGRLYELVISLRLQRSLIK